MSDNNPTNPRRTGPGILPSRPDPIARAIKRVDRALGPHSPCDRLAEVAKKIGRPPGHTRTQKP